MIVKSNSASNVLVTQWLRKLRGQENTKESAEKYTRPYKKTCWYDGTANPPHQSIFVLNTILHMISQSLCLWPVLTDNNQLHRYISVKGNPYFQKTRTFTPWRVVTEATWKHFLKAAAMSQTPKHFLRTRRLDWVKVRLYKVGQRLSLKSNWLNQLFNPDRNVRLVRWYAS